MRALSALSVVMLASCGPRLDLDPVYQSLLANQPPEIPEKHLQKLQRGLASCDVFKEGQSDQYMTCWWPSGRPALIAPGGKPVVTLPLK